MSEIRSTKTEILTKLRHRPMTISELGHELKVTRNAVLVPLTDLESRGLIRRVSVERTGRAGKPAQRYEIVPEMFEATSPAYQSISPHLLAVLASGTTSSTGEAMEAVGKSMHKEVNEAVGRSERLGLAAALKFLSQQGAEIEISPDGKDILVMSHSCPVGRLVRTDTCICSAIASFLAAASGCPASAECDYADKLTCCFRIEAGKTQRDLLKQLRHAST
ncbi:hypothetical protein IED13_24470 [Bosea sp. SSUT16]|uniref:HTH marR-type domain-containing protein n=1 Tax=Bosea spartocytisi TaxID=2773451 RepID=A0A927EDK7_9HYPH|nr:hypothetical protein [Bosea spartocytisi]MBD3848865.1 hypothetical protein [Bosea spartocytisi]